jgi:hypothetical protein
MGSEELRLRLQHAVEDAVMGENLGPALASRIELAARGELSRAGVRGGRVQVRQQGRGLEVLVTLPPGPARVRELVLRIG